MDFRRGLLHAAALGDVAVDAQEPVEAARGIEQRGDDGRCPEARAVLAHTLAFLFEPSLVPRLGEIHRRLAVGDLLGGVEHRHVAADDLVGLVAGIAPCALVPGGDAAASVEHDDGVLLRRLDEQSQPLLGGMRGGLDPRLSVDCQQVVLGALQGIRQPGDDETVGDEQNQVDGVGGLGQRREPEVVQRGRNDRGEQRGRPAADQPRARDRRVEEDVGQVGARDRQGGPTQGSRDRDDGQAGGEPGADRARTPELDGFRQRPPRSCEPHRWGPAVVGQGLRLGAQVLQCHDLRD